MMRGWVWFGVMGALVACKGPTEVPGQCEANDAPTIDIAQREDWNVPSGVINFGIPPQGGAPYAPFEVRLVGVEFSEAYRIVLSATVDGEVFETPAYNERFVCRNVGEEAGTRYSPDLHLRFFGTEPPALDGLDITVNIDAFIGTEGPIVSRSVSGTLDWNLGPIPEE